MYDWANSAFDTTIVAAVFPIYFASVAAAEVAPPIATARFAAATAIAKLAIAVASPLLGAIADCAAVKKKMLAAFLAVGVLATAALALAGRGEWLFAAAVFVLARIGASGSFVFYDSLLPHIATRGEIDRVSSAGYAIGYLGGGVLLSVNLLWIQQPHWFGLADAAAASRASFLSVAVWWALFSIPLLIRVPEPPRRLERGEGSQRSSFALAVRRLASTLRELRGHRQAFLFLLAFVVYNDGIGTIIAMAAIYGTEIGIPAPSLVGALLFTQLVGIPFAFAFGSLAGRIGAKRAVFLALAVYTIISTLGYFMTSSLHFFLLAGLVGTVQGGSQALGRSLFASMIPKHRSSEFFAFFAVFERVAGIVGPAIFAGVTRGTGSGRGAILSVIAFFVLGGILLAFVDVEEGQREARLAEDRVDTGAGA
jgi:UMF1 family MFS transporter